MTANEVEFLADRVHAVLAGHSVTTRRMFGGVTFLLRGNMLCCASAKGLMVRVGAAAEARALESPHARPCLGAGRRMAGFLMIDPGGIDTDKRLREWIAQAQCYVEMLPPKAAGKKRSPGAINKRKGRRA